VTLSVLTWWNQAISTSPLRTKIVPISIDVNKFAVADTPCIYAADPVELQTLSSTPLINSQYTSEAYQTRTNLPCHVLSFNDIAEGRYPWEDGSELPEEMMIICSFALHLAETSSLFSLLYSLSTRSRWLVILAPHKKPEVSCR